MPKKRSDPPVAVLLDHAEAIAAQDPSGESDARWQAAAQLHERGGDAVFERAAQWCRASDPLLRSFGADVLGQLGFADGMPHAADSEPLLDALLGDPDSDVVASALHAMGHLNLGAPSRLRAFAASDASEVRYAVVCCLGSREDEVSQAVLLELSEDADSDVRDWATFGLGSMTDRDTSEIRAALFARIEDEDHETRCEAMLGLAARGDARAAPFIEAELGSEEVGQLAVEAAALLGDARFLPHLEALLECNPDDETLIEAVARCSD